VVPCIINLSWSVLLSTRFHFHFVFHYHLPSPSNMSQSANSIAGSVNPVVESVNSVAESGNSALKYPMSTPLTDSEASLIVFAKPRDKSDVIRTLRGQAAVLSRFGGKDGKLNQVQTDIDTLIREGGDELNKKWPSQQPETVNSPPPPSGSGSQQRGSTAQAQSGRETGPEPLTVNPNSSSTKRPQTKLPKQSDESWRQ
jgi:hypothetical protein